MIACRRVKVLNKGTDTFDYEVTGERIKLEPGESMETERRHGIAIKGTYTGKSNKSIIELIPIVVDKPKEAAKSGDYYAIVDGKTYKTKQGYLTAVRALAAKDAADEDVDPIIEEE